MQREKWWDLVRTGFPVVDYDFYSPDTGSMAVDLRRDSTRFQSNSTTAESPSEAVQDISQWCF